MLLRNFGFVAWMGSGSGLLPLGYFLVRGAPRAALATAVAVALVEVLRPWSRPDRTPPAWAWGGPHSLRPLRRHHPPGRPHRRRLGGEPDRGAHRGHHVHRDLVGSLVYAVELARRPELSEGQRRHLVACLDRAIGWEDL